MLLLGVTVVEAEIDALAEAVPEADGVRLGDGEAVLDWLGEPVSDELPDGDWV